VVIGPEGGWASGEVPEDAIRWDLGDTVLRVETAALVAAARLL
jgi:16S rRNA U1498 N3-methylase RsmE